MGVAAAVLLGAGLITWAILKGIRTFGAYEARRVAYEERRTKSDLLILAIHESQQILLGQNDELLAELRRAKTNGHKEVA